MSAIEPFEASLRENTPLTSINDPSALVEYLSQLNLKGDMVMDELKRVSGDKDSIKVRLDAAEQAAKNAQAEAEELKKERDDLLTRVKSSSNDGKEADGDGDDFFSYESELHRLQDVVQQKNARIEELEIAKQTVTAELDTVRASHEQTLKDIKTSQVDYARGNEDQDLKRQFEVLESQSKDIKKAIASTAPDASKELPAQVHELCTLLEFAQTARDNAVRHLQELRSAVVHTDYNDSTDGPIDDAAVLAMQDHVRAIHFERLEAKKTLDESRAELQKRLDETTQALKAAEGPSTHHTDTAESRDRIQNLTQELDAAYLTLAQTGLFDSIDTTGNSAEKTETAAPVAETPPNTNGSATKKKGKNKKKKGGATAPKSPVIDDNKKPQIEDIEAATDVRREVKLTDGQRSAIKAKLAQTSATSNGHATELQAIINDREGTIASLKKEISEKERQIETMNSRLKGEDALREEIESLRDSLTLIGDDHVVVKDKCKTLQAERDELKKNVGSVDSAAVEALRAEKKALEETVTSHAEEIAALKANMGTGKDKDADLTQQLEKLQADSTALERDLSAARELAQARFKDMTALRDHLNKIQPELNSLKKSNEELKGGEQKLQQLERSSEALRSEVESLKSKIADKDAEIKRTSERMRNESSKAAGLQEKLDRSQRAQTTTEAQHKESSEARTRLTTDLSAARDEVKSLKGRLERLEQRAATQGTEAQSVKEELALKTAQQASAQSLMDSMQDQTRELATQMKELRERCESLEEERADAHRLLQERSREGETMRRLLSDVETRAEARIKEMKDRLNLAVEERDRAEDDASTAARRKAKVIEELRSQLTESEKTAADALRRRQELESRETSAGAQRKELETRAQRAQDELDEARASMDRLRDALEASEKSSRDAERETSDLKRAVEDRERRLEKLQKGSKSMAEELRALQERSAPAKRPQPAGSGSSRSSVDSHRVMSPGGATTSSRHGSIAAAADGLDYAYLKTILLQFLEQKDKKHQMQLVPVLGMLLRFDRYVFPLLLSVSISRF